MRKNRSTTIPLAVRFGNRSTACMKWQAGEIPLIGSATLPHRREDDIVYSGHIKWR
nr:MAG TPA: hypothetical protein [Caudoviricetes sp.]